MLQKDREDTERWYTRVQLIPPLLHDIQSFMRENSSSLLRYHRYNPPAAIGLHGVPIIVQERLKRAYNLHFNCSLPRNFGILTRETGIFEIPGHVSKTALKGLS